MAYWHHMLSEIIVNMGSNIVPEPMLTWLSTRNKFQWNLIYSSFIQESAFVIVICKMAICTGLIMFYINGLVQESRLQ